MEQTPHYLRRNENFGRVISKEVGAKSSPETWKNTRQILGKRKISSNDTRHRQAYKKDGDVFTEKHYRNHDG